MADLKSLGIDSALAPNTSSSDLGSAGQEPPSLQKARATLLTRFCTEILHQLSMQEDKRMQWARWLTLYKAAPMTKKKMFPWPEASNIVIAMIGEYVDSVVARIMQSTFSNEPHWVGTQLNKKWSANVEPLSRYLDWARQYVWDQYRVVKQVVLEFCKLGTSILYNGWLDMPLYRWDPTTRQSVQNGIRRGPDPQWIAREDFLIPEGYIDISKAPWVAIRWWFSHADIKKLVKSGFFSMPPDFDLKKLVDTEQRIRHSEMGEVSDMAPQDLVSLWQVWLAEDMDDDGFPEEHIIWIHPNSQSMWRYEANPYLYGMRPIIKFTFVEKEGEFDGVGVAEMCEQYQDEVTTMHNQRRDNATIANTRALVARRGSGIAADQKLYPGVVIFATDTKDVEPFQLGDVYPSSIADEQRTVQLAQQRVGVNDVNQGQITPPIGRATATTVMSQLQEGTRRFDLNTAELRRGLSEQAMQICELYQTHGLPDPDQPNSPEQVLDPEDAVLVRQIIENADQVRGLVALKLNVSTAAVNREIEKQSSIQLFQMVMQYYQQVLQIMPQMFNPQMPPQMQQMIVKMVNGADKMLEMVFKSHQRFDLEDVLLMEDQNAGQPTTGGGPGAQPMATPQGMPLGGAPGANGAPPGMQQLGGILGE